MPINRVARELVAQIVSRQGAAPSVTEYLGGIAPRVGIAEPLPIFDQQEALRGPGPAITHTPNPAKIIFGRRRVSPIPAFGLGSQRTVRVGYALSLGEIETVRYVWSTQHDERMPMQRGRLAFQTWYGNGNQTPQLPLGAVPLATWSGSGIYDDGGYVAATTATPETAVSDVGALEDRLTQEDADSLPWDGVITGKDGRHTNIGNYVDEDGKISRTPSVGTPAGNHANADKSGRDTGNSKSKDIVSSGAKWAGILGVVGLIFAGPAGAVAGALRGAITGATSKATELYVAEPLGRAVGRSTIAQSFKESKLGQAFSRLFGKDDDGNPEPKSENPHGPNSIGRNGLPSDNNKNFDWGEPFANEGPVPGNGNPPGEKSGLGTTVGSTGQDEVNIGSGGPLSVGENVGQQGQLPGTGGAVLTDETIDPNDAQITRGGGGDPGVPAPDDDRSPAPPGMNPGAGVSVGDIVSVSDDTGRGRGVVSGVNSDGTLNVNVAVPGPGLSIIGFVPVENIDPQNVQPVSTPAPDDEDDDDDDTPPGGGGPDDSAPPSGDTGIDPGDHEGDT